MSGSFGRRYLTAARYSISELARNRFAFGLLIVFVPTWFYLFGILIQSGPVSFKLSATNSYLTVNGHNLTLLTAGLNALTLIVGFLIFAATRKGAQFDRRLVLSGYPQLILILAKVTALVAASAAIALYTTLVLLIFWRPGGGILLIWLGFFCGALIYGGLGLLLGVLVSSELTGFFLIIMVSLFDTLFQNPIDNPAANKDFLKAFPAYGPTQTAVTGGFTHALPWHELLLSLAWFVGLALVGLAIFWWKTRAWNARRAPLPQAQAA